MLRAGFNIGDVILLVASNGLDTCIPLYVGLMTGLPVLPIAGTPDIVEFEHVVKLSQPKITFCTQSNKNLVQKVLNTTESSAIVIVMDDPLSDIEAFISGFGTISEDDINEYEPIVLPRTSTACLVTSSGTTAKSKLITISHDNLLFKYRMLLYKSLPKSSESFLVLSPVQWMTSLYLYYFSGILVFTRIQTSVQLSMDLLNTVLKKYKPTCMISSPSKVLEMINNDCDLSSIKQLLVGGSAPVQKLDYEIKRRYKNMEYLTIYGMTELLGVGLEPQINGPLLNIGKEFPIAYKYRLVDNSTGKNINKPNIIGELWIKCESPFVGYHKNSEESVNALSRDGYLKTGDLMYKNENGYYFFVGRIKGLIRYDVYNVLPLKIENVLKSHPAVENAAAVGLNDDEAGELPLAFVTVKKDQKVTAEELHEMVTRQLSDEYKLRGGIIFINEFPLTASGKINLRILRNLIPKNLKEQ